MLRIFKKVVPLHHQTNTKRHDNYTKSNRKNNSGLVASLTDLPTISHDGVGGGERKII